MALLDIGNSSGGLLSQMFGPAVNSDPLGQFMGTQYYDPNDARAAGVSNMLKNMSAELLYRGPRRGGDLATIGRAMSAGGTGYKEGKTSYLQQGMSKKLAADEMRRKQYAEDQQIAQDKAWLEFAAGLPPDIREQVINNPELAQAVGKEWAQSLYPDPTSRGSGDWGVSPSRMVDEQGNIFYRQFSKDGKTQIVSETPGARPVGQLKMVETVEGTVPLDPYTGKPRTGPVPGSDPGALAQEKAVGAATGKGQGEMNVDAIGFMQDLPVKVGRLNAVKANSSKYAGMSPEKFVNILQNPTEFYAWNQTVQAIQADVTASAMGKTKSLYPMSEDDRKFMMTMATGGVTPWYNPANFNRAIDIIKNSYKERALRIQRGEETSSPTLDIETIFGGEEVWDAEGNRVK